MTFLVPRIAESHVAAIFKVNVKTKLIPPLHHHVFEVRDVIFGLIYLISKPDPKGIIDSFIHEVY